MQPSFYAADADDTLLSLLSTRNASRMLPLLDDSHRPVALAGRSSSGELTRRAALCVLENCPADEALKRALTRPESTRFDPLMCCDESGQFRGIVRVERLVEALLDLTRSR